MYSMIPVVYKHFHRIPSTNSWAMEHAESLDKTAVTIITADEQTAGRGREGRGWVSTPSENLTITYCLFWEADNNHLFNVGQLLALSCSELLQQEYQQAAKLKWPNDIMIGKKKIGGILSQAKTVGKSRFLAVGLGLNINMPQKMLREIDRPATSLMEERGAPVDIELFTKQLHHHFLQALPQLKEEGFRPFHTRFEKKIGIGEAVTFHSGSQQIQGRIVSCGTDGSITLALDNGKKRTFFSGEIVNEDRVDESQGQG